MKSKGSQYALPFKEILKLSSKISSTYEDRKNSKPSCTYHPA